MAGRTLSKPLARCNSCAAYGKVSLTLEWCKLLARPVLGEDVECLQFTSDKPWLAWGEKSEYVGRAARV